MRDHSVKTETQALEHYLWTWQRFIITFLRVRSNNQGQGKSVYEDRLTGYGTRVNEMTSVPASFELLCSCERQGVCREGHRSSDSLTIGRQAVLLLASRHVPGGHLRWDAGHGLCKQLRKQMNTFEPKWRNRNLSSTVEPFGCSSCYDYYCYWLILV